MQSVFNFVVCFGIFFKDAYVCILKKGTILGEFWKLKHLGLDISSGILNSAVNNFTYIY